MLDVLDELGDPLSELTEAAQDAGLGDELPFLQEANDVWLDAITENGVPDETYRFLHRPPDPAKRPSASEDTEDLVKQAGHILDNLAGGPGYAKLGAAVLTDKVLESGKNKGTDPTQWEFEHPSWSVEWFRCEEGLNQLFRCEVILVRPATVDTTTAYDDPIAQMLATLDPDNARARGLDDRQGRGPVDWTGGTPIAVPLGPLGGAPLPTPALRPWQNTGVGEDIVEAVDGVRDFVDKVRDPANFLDNFSDVEDPDMLDPLAYAGVPITAAVDPSEFLLKPCRLCVARRFEADKFTLQERWFSGVAIEFEDLGVRYRRGFRAVRLVIVPRTWVLTQTRRCRVFHDKTALEIVASILEEHGLFKVDAEVTYPDRMIGELRLSPPPKDLLGGAIGIPGAAATLASKAGEIVDAAAGVFGADAGVADAIDGALRKDLEAWGHKREFCVQYNETDLEFVERLLAEEGVTYWFESLERRERLVLADDPFHAGKKILTLTRLPLRSIGNIDDVPALRAREVAWSHTVQRRLVPTTVTLRDHSMSFPRSCTELVAGAAAPSLAGGIGVGEMIQQATALVGELADRKGTEDYAGASATYFEYPGGLIFVPDDDQSHRWPGAAYARYAGPDLASFVLDRLRLEGALGTCGSNCATIQPGHNVRVGIQAFDVLREEDAIDEATGLVRKAPRYVVTRAVHQGGRAERYRNRFDAYHVKLRHRPRRIAKPRIEGVQTAIVLATDLADAIEGGAKVGEPHVDTKWRVLVRFPWDPRPANDTPERAAHSGWVRYAERWAGDSFGTLFAPRVGMEVIVGFEEGDPDRPVILGALYNGHVGSANDNAYHPHRHESLKPRPNEKDAQNVSFVWSESWPARRESDRAAQRANWLYFNDNRGREQIALHAQKDLVERIEHDHVTSVLVDQHNRVSGRHEEIVGKDQTLFVNHPSNRDDVLDAGRTASVGTDEERHVGTGTDGLRHVKVGGNVSRTIEGKRREWVGHVEVLEVRGEGDAPPVAAGAEPNAAQSPARELIVHGSHLVRLDHDDELRVDGDRRETVAMAYEVTARSIDMSLRGDTDVPADARSGLKIDERGIRAASQGAVHTRSKAMRITSDDELLVEAATVLRIAAGENTIVLDGLRGVIEIHAEEQGGIRIGSEESYLELTDHRFRIVGGGASIDGDTTAGDEARITLDAPAGVTLSFEGEIHFNAHDATKLQQAPSIGSVVAQSELANYHADVKRYEDYETMTWPEIEAAEGLSSGQKQAAPSDGGN